MTTSLEKGIYILLESTSNGTDNIFYELCKDAVNKRNDFHLIFIPWFWHKEYTSFDIKHWDASKEWLEYKKQYHLSIYQLRWAYLKNQILCKVSGENCEKGPSIYFKREFPATYEEAFLNDIDNSFIPLEVVTKNAVSINDLAIEDINLCPHILAFKAKKLTQYNKEIILGVDIARGGDLTWIIDRQGDFLGFNINKKINLKDSMRIAYWIAQHIQEINPTKVFIDAGGIGISIVDRLTELGYGNKVKGIYFNAKAFNTNRYINKRAEMWFSLKEFIEKGGYIVNDPLLLKQISSTKSFYNYKGQLQIENKQNIKNILHHSPDGADAAILTFAGEGKNIPPIVMGDLLTEYDPFIW